MVDDTLITPEQIEKVLKMIKELDDDRNNQLDERKQTENI